MRRLSTKKIVPIAAIMLLLFTGNASVAQSGQDTLMLTLDQALEIALSENLTVKVADQEITKQEYAKKGTYAALFPQIDANGSYQRTIKKQMMYMDMDLTGSGTIMDSGFPVGRDNDWAVGVSASMQLISPVLWKSLKISGYDVELSVEKARSSRIEMADQIRQAFYGVLLAGDSYHVFKEAYDNAVHNYNDIKQKFDQGLVAEFDLIRADVNVKNAEPSMYDAENSLMLASWRLKAIMGIDLGTNIKCIGRLADYEDTIAGGYILADLSLDSNSSLKQLDIQYNQLEEVRKLNRAQYYPTLSANFSYRYQSSNNDFKFNNYNWDPYSTVGLTLSIPIFSGGKRHMDIKQSEINIRQLSDQRMDTERNLRVSIKQYTDQMSTCVKQYNAAKAGVKQAEKSYNISAKRYETGEGTLLEINDSQLSLTQARLNLNQSIYSYMVAKSTLEKTLGNTK